MKSLFNPVDAAEIVARIQTLQPGAAPKWGKMDAAQMLTHCQRPFAAFFDSNKGRQTFIGILFGGLMKKQMLRPDKSFKQNLPTDKNFIIKDAREFVVEKQELLTVIKKFAESAETQALHSHPFFGKMNREEWGILSYKHLNHHLEQFGV